MAMPHTQTIDDPALAFDLAPTIFHEDWWLTAATDGAYRAVEVKENGRVVARFPYLLRHYMGLPFHVMPPLTHFLGPAVHAREDNERTRFFHRLNLTRQLIDALPPSKILKIKCSGYMPDAVPFQEKGFKTSVQFTFEIVPQTEESIWQNLRSPRRTIIRGAMKNGLTVEVYQDVEGFLSFYKKNLTARNETSFVDLRICRSLIAASLERQRGRILVARDALGRICAAIFYVWDSKVAYYLMTSRALDSHSGAVSLLAWSAIKECASRGLIFDFDGLFNKGSVPFLTGFGAQVRPRYIVEKASLPFLLLWNVKEHFRAGRCFN